MEKKKLQSVSIAALIVSILPLAALAPSLLHFSLSVGIRTAWAGANIVFVLLGLILSVVCVRSRESRSVINIVSTAVSYTHLDVYKRQPAFCSLFFLIKTISCLL